MSVINLFSYEDAQAREYTAKKWATVDEMKAYSSGDELRDVILGRNASVAFFDKDKC